MLTFQGHSDGKVIVPDEAVDLPTGQRLRVTVEQVHEANPPRTSRKSLHELIREIEAKASDVDLPSDLAAQVDHYLYGSPKR